MTGDRKKRTQDVSEKRNTLFFFGNKFLWCRRFPKEPQNIAFFTECAIIKSQSNRVQKNKK